MILPVIGTVLVAGALFVMLGYWIMVRWDHGLEGESYPPWFTDLDDTSWQRALAPNASGRVGLGPNTPVRVCGAAGEQAYLSSLTCDADPPTIPFPDPFAAAGARKEHLRPLLYPRIVDRYEVPCAGATVDLYLSPYHCKGEMTEEVPSGFVPRFEGG